MVFNYNILAAEKSTAVSKIEIKLNLMTLCKKKMRVGLYGFVCIAVKPVITLDP